MRRVGCASIALLAAICALPAAAQAVPRCEGVGEPRTILSGEGLLEAVLVKPGHGLLYGDQTAGALKLLADPGAAPEVVVDGVPAPGGIAGIGRDHVLLGYHSGVVNGVLGNLAAGAGLLNVDLARGEAGVRVEGLQMANGVARAPDGTIYASNDFGLAGIDRVSGGSVDVGWGPVYSANGLVVDPTGTHLYAAQTFAPAAIARVEIANPRNVTTLMRPGLLDIAGGFDGMTRDRAGNIYVAANSGGAAFRVTERGEACVLARGIPLMSDVALGRGERGFSRTSLYAVSFLGTITEIPGALAPGG